MKTILRGSAKEVIIDTNGPVIIIGESINPTRRKKLVSALQEGSFDYVLELAESQIKAGADVLDVNVGFPGVDDVKLLPETVRVLQENFDVPLCLDSPNPKAIEAALKVAEGKCLINSVNGEEASMKALLPVAREYGAAIIGLCMDDEGITHEPEKRLAIAEKIINRDIADRILKASQRISIPSLLSKLKAVQSAQKNLRSNANSRLTMEILLMRLAI